MTALGKLQDMKYLTLYFRAVLSLVKIGHTLLWSVNLLVRTFHIYCSMWVKFGIRNHHGLL